MSDKNPSATSSNLVERLRPAPTKHAATPHVRTAAALGADSARMLGTHFASWTRSRAA
jgi:hypothetical protein